MNKINKNKERDLNDPNIFFEKIMNENKKTGVRITNNNNEYKQNPFSYDILIKSQNLPETISYNQDFYNNLDLNINNYKRDDIIKLFNIKDHPITDNIIKECKKIVNKSHPDKSKLHEKYFIFFTKAYNKLVNIYNFDSMLQNSPDNLANRKEDIIDILNKEDFSAKEHSDFNREFNRQFESQKLENPSEIGYETWLKSDDDILFTPATINKNNINTEIDKYKQQIKTVTKYNGIQNSTPSFSGYSLMQQDNFTLNKLFDNTLNYTDLKQAYVESVIPVTDEDYNKIPKFNTLDEYKQYRNNVMNQPMDAETALQELYFNQYCPSEENDALAFYYATQSEKRGKKI
jgi:hypothetical protein